MKKINTRDLPSRHKLTLKADERLSLCRCWQSKTFPLCDGSHRDYAAQTQDDIGPLTIVGETWNV